MGVMKEFEIRIRNGGDDAVAAMAELWESREKILFDITDAFTKARWIPVGERLPELDERVMICNVPDRWVSIGSRQLTGTYHHWDGDDYEELHTPTHWMPLPEPPEVK